MKQLTFIIALLLASPAYGQWRPAVSYSLGHQHGADCYGST